MWTSTVPVGGFAGLYKSGVGGETTFVITAVLDLTAGATGAGTGLGVGSSYHVT